MNIQGVVSRIIYDGRSKGNNFMVFAVQDIDSVGKKPINYKVSGNYDPLIVEGGYVEIEGDLTNDKYGEQIKMEKISAMEVSKEELSENLKRRALLLILKEIHGVGEVLANNIIDQLNLLEKTYPLNSVYEFSQKNSPILSKYIKDSIKNTFDVNGAFFNYAFELLSLSQNITMKQTKKAFDLFPDIFDILNNPYVLIEIDGITFQTADIIAKEIGYEPKSPERITAGMYYLLKQSFLSPGNMFLPKDKFLFEAKKLLGDYPDDEFLDIFEREYNLFVIENDNFYLKINYYIEHSISENIESLLSTPSELNKNLNETLKQIKSGDYQLTLDNGDDLSDEQKEAVAKSLSNKVSVITGGPGVGKTTVSEALVQGFLDSGFNQDDILCVAPTGKAAKRMSESIKLPSMTIHKAIGFNGDEFEVEEVHQKVILIDESSMLDASLTKELLSRVKNDAIVVFIGDVDQIPSVQAGRVLKDLIDSDKIAVSRLNTIFRQAALSGIVVKSHQVKDRNFSEFMSGINDYDDLKFTKVNDSLAKSISQKKGVDKSASDFIADIVIVKYLKMIKDKEFDPYEDIQVLSPMRKGKCGIFELNRKIRDAVNPIAQEWKNFPEKRNGIPKIDTEHYVFFVGDKIMQTKNDYEKNVVNGEIGVIDGIDIRNKEVLCDFGNNKKVYYELSEFFGKIEPAWAITKHKSQGSEYKGVIIPISTEHEIMMFSELIYTAMTRAKKSLEIIGDDECIKRALNNGKRTQRNTSLSSFLKSIPDVDFNNEDIDEEENQISLVL